MHILLSPPVAFLVYIPLVALLLLLGRKMAGPQEQNSAKSSIYSSGEEAPMYSAAPGYRPFILVAFFFAFLHLGLLVLGTGSFSFSVIPYLLGLIIALVALLLG